MADDGLAAELGRLLDRRDAARRLPWVFVLIASALLILVSLLLPISTDGIPDLQDAEEVEPVLRGYAAGFGVALLGAAVALIRWRSRVVAMIFSGMALVGVVLGWIQVSDLDGLVGPGAWAVLVGLAGWAGAAIALAVLPDRAPPVRGPAVTLEVQTLRDRLPNG